MSYQSQILLLLWAAGSTSYILTHNQALTLLAVGLDILAAQLGSISGVAALSVPLGLQQIFDRKGIIGVGSYDFTEEELSGPDYNLVINAGAFWTAASFPYKSTATTISLALLSTGDYFLNIDVIGTPSVAASASNAVRQFHWDAATHIVSAKALYAGIAVLFDGDDYADMLTSAARAKSFTKVADRFEEIEEILTPGVQEITPGDTVEIDWSLGGHARLLLDRATTAITLTGGYDGQKCILELIQDGTGGRAVTFGAEVVGGTDFTLPIPISSALDKADHLGFIYDATSGKYRYVSLARGYDV